MPPSETFVPFSRPRIAFRRLLVMTCALVALLAPASAWAIAPMCDEQAQTIEAPAPIYPSKSGAISAGTLCKDGPGSELGSAPSRDPGRPLITADAIDRGLVTADRIPPCAKSARLGLFEAELGRARAGSGDDVFRPPRR